ncbi:MAG: hypothetical protein QOJ65_700 [Fimbriimonadaceae bacterium]|jgi:hypothetical protein|nr:hypothetical protein [Fimbriimonadaceae bacterium]
MPNDANLDVVGHSLDEALLRMQSLEERLKKGDDVPQEEMDEIARQVAHGLEDALDALKELVGPENQEEIEKEMIAKMSDEEYDEWSRTYPLRQAFRAERKQEKLAQLNG